MYIMLGINETRESVKAPFAQQMRDSLRRANTGKLNDSERSHLDREQQLSEMFTSVWC